MEEVNQRGAVLWWLDEPICRAVPLRYGFQFNPRLAWFTDRLPGRARTLLRNAALGELRDHDPGAARRIPPAQTQLSLCDAGQGWQQPRVWVSTVVGLRGRKVYDLVDFRRKPWFHNWNYGTLPDATRAKNRTNRGQRRDPNEQTRRSKMHRDL